MFRWLSLTKVLTVGVLGFAVYAAEQSGWIAIDVELGGTRTGELTTSTSGPNSAPSFPSFRGGGQGGGTSQSSEAHPPVPPLRKVGKNEDEQFANDERSPSLASSEPTTDTPQRKVSSILQVSEEQPTEGTKSKPSATASAAASAITELDEPPVRIAARPNDAASKLDLSSIDAQLKAGQLVEAHKALSKIFWQQPELRSQLQERIDATAKAIYFAPQPHVQEPYVIQAGDQLRKVAGQHRVPWQYLSKLNRVDPRRIREGQKLKVIDGPFGAVVTLSDFELVVHHGGQYVRRYRACIGKDDSSPVGKFKVLNKVTSPQYTDPDGKVFAGTDPKNPLGSHWIDLGESYGIHGTIEPDSIGKAESRGCVRLLNADVAEVYDMLDLGSEVILRR